MTIFACVILYFRWKADNFMNYLRPLCLQALQCGIIIGWFKYGVRSPKFIWAPCAQLYSLAETMQPPPPPRILAHIRGRYWSAKTDDTSLRPLWCTNTITV
jgi:hypothetical protein